MMKVCFSVIRFKGFASKLKNAGDPTKSCDGLAPATDITFKMKICANKCLKDKEEALLNFPAYGQLRIEVGLDFRH